MWHTEDVRLYVELLVVVSALMLVSRGPPLSFCPSKEKHQVRHKHISVKGRWTHLSFLFRPLQAAKCTAPFNMHELTKANLPCCTEGRVLTRCFSSASSCRVWKLLVEEMNFNIVQCNEYKVCWCWNHCSAIFCILIKMCIKITSCLSLLPSILRHWVLWVPREST